MEPTLKVDKPQKIDSLNREDIILEIYRNRSEMEAQIILRGTGEVIDRIPVAWKSRENKLDYLSVSKISAYEQCPACFYKQYIAEETKSVDNSNYFTKFGSIMHEVVEQAMKIYRDMGIVANPVTLLDEAWTHYDLQGFADYDQARTLLLQYFQANPVDNRPDVPLLIEEEWRGELGGVTFGLVFDYVGQMKGQNVGLLRDYKTNRMPFTPNDLQNSLQLRIYELVLKRHYFPEFEKWIAGYDLFFHGWQRCPDWTDDDLQRAEDYVSVIATQIQNDNVWEERINNYCCYRECRHTCEAYQKLMKSKASELSAVKIDSTDLEEVERERVRMQAIEKTAKGRVQECSDILKAEIEERAKLDGKLIIDGKELSLYANQTSSYRYQDTRNMLLVQGKLDLLDDCLSISKTKLDAKLKGDPSLKLQLAGCMSTNYASPYIVTKKAK